MLGKVTSVVRKADMPAEETKKKKWATSPQHVAVCGAAADVPAPWQRESCGSSLLEVYGQLQATQFSSCVARPSLIRPGCGILCSRMHKPSLRYYVHERFRRT